ncbi:MAG: cell division ATPase MinD [Candidatus Aenigmarchaeota archaeon]|nr:cell division ATPase MinD [Candidatus Aenigmarchaeota archaeon]
MPLPRIIAITSGKGGVGKTTVSVNLSATLVNYFKKKVTIIDANVTTPHLALHFGIYKYDATLNDVLRGRADLSDASILHPSGIQIIPASLNLTDLVGVDIATLGDVLKDMLPTEDFIIIDSAPGFGKEAVSALKACEEAIIVSTPTVPAIMDAIKAKKVLQELGVENLGLVLNKVMGRKYELKRSEITELIDLPVLAEIPFDEKFQEALAAKMPLILYDRKSPTTLQFLELASILTGEKYEMPRLSIWARIRKLFWKFS